VGVLTPDVETIGEARAILGEGVIWQPETKTVLWVDIVGRRVIETDPATGAAKEWPFPEQTAFVQPAADGTWLVGQQGGVVRFDPASGRTTPFVDIEADDPTTRTNDAACDPSGRLVVGTVRLPEAGLAPVGSLYRVTGDGNVTVLDSGLYVPNGIAFSPDGRIAYWADTYKTRRQIWSADHDPDTGHLGPKRPFATIGEADGRPDGAVVDAAGCYWVAAVWGWQLLRFTPKGTVDLAVRLPVQRPTKLAFGGPDLTTIFVVSISDDYAVGPASSQPLAGRLLALNVGIAGLPPVRFRGVGRSN